MGSGEGEGSGWSTEDFRAGKLLLNDRETRLHAFLKLMEGTTSSANLNVNDRLQVTVMLRCRFMIVAYATIATPGQGWGMLIVGEAVCRWGPKVYGKSLYFLLNFAVSLKLF